MYLHHPSFFDDFPAVGLRLERFVSSSNQTSAENGSFCRTTQTMRPKGIMAWWKFKVAVFAATELMSLVVVQWLQDGCSDEAKTLLLSDRRERKAVDSESCLNLACEKLFTEVRILRGRQDLHKGFQGRVKFVVPAEQVPGCSCSSYISLHTNY